MISSHWGGDRFRRPLRKPVAIALGVALFAGGTFTGADAASIDFRTYDAAPSHKVWASIGVAVHDNYKDKAAYRDSQNTLKWLSWLGVGHIRDGIDESSHPFYRSFVQQAGPGAGVSYVADTNDGTVDQLVARLGALKGTIRQIEGDNERDCGSFPAAKIEEQKNKQRTLNAALKRLGLGDYPLASTSFCSTHTSPQAYANDGVSDYTNLHPYAAGFMPEEEIRQFINNANSTNGRMGVVVTEGGYHNAMDVPANHHTPTSERAAAAYEPRMFLDYFQAGIASTTSYELFDLEAPRSNYDQVHFGLIRNSMTPKPAAEAVRVLAHTLKDPAGLDLGNRQVRIAHSGPSDLQVLPMVRADGSIDVAVWRKISVYDRSNKRDLPDQPATATLTLPSPTSASYVRTHTGLDNRTPVCDSCDTMQIPVSAHPTIVRLGRTTGGLGPVPTTPPTGPSLPSVDGKYDLTVTNVTTTPANPRPGDVVRFTATIKNTGTAATPAGVVHGVRFDHNGTFTSFADLHKVALAPGASVTLTANGAPTGQSSTWKATGGTHEVRAWVDDINRLPAESNEANNTLAVTIKVDASPSTPVEAKPTVTLTKMANGHVRVAGTGFVPNSRVTVVGRIGNASGTGTLTADAGGHVRGRFNFRNTMTGDFVVTLKAGDRTANSSISLQPRSHPKLWSIT